jgi:hypothetical protein
MRLFKTSDAAIEPHVLWRELLTQPGAASATPDLIKALNSHVNLDQPIPPNTVLLIPDAADVKAGAGTGVGSDALDDFLADAEAAVKAMAASASAGFKQVEANHAAIGAAVRPAAVKRIIDSDPQVKKLLESADAQFKADQKLARDTQSQLADMQKRALNEFARLRKMLDG